MSKPTPGPWFVSGVRFEMNGGEWHSINRYDEANKRDQNIACVGYDPRTGDGMADARLIAAAPDLLEALSHLVAEAYLDGMDRRAGWDCWVSLAEKAIAKASVQGASMAGEAR